MFLAGIETTAGALTWSLYLLGRHREIAARVCVEVDSVLGGRRAAWEDVSRLGEVKRVLTESLRLYPPGWIFTRVTTREVDLGPHRLPEGTGVAYSPYVLHRQDAAFERPEEFDPDRWSPQRAADVPPGAYVPFGGGVHVCIGDTFGMTEVTLALATVISRWTFTPLDDRMVEPAARRATLTPGPLPMRVHRRGSR